MRTRVRILQARSRTLGAAHLYVLRDARVRVDGFSVAFFGEEQQAHKYMVLPMFFVFVSRRSCRTEDR